jgi:transposase-like protein
LLGKDAPGLSASTIARLKEVWIDEHKRWNERDLSTKRYVYVWADGIHLQARLEDNAQCILVIIGATREGRKETCPIESTFATVRHRTIRSKGCLSNGANSYARPRPA